MFFIYKVIYFNLKEEFDKLEGFMLNLAMYQKIAPRNSQSGLWKMGVYIQWHTPHLGTIYEAQGD